MKISIEKYNPDWKKQFNSIKHELGTILGNLNPSIEHIGSTSVQDLSAKPIIDVLVGLKNIDELDKTIAPMKNNNYIYYQLFNKFMPYRRLFVGLKDSADIKRFKSEYREEDVVPHSEINNLRISHVHIWKKGIEDWVRHIAFRDYLQNHESIRNEYALLKEELSQNDWKNGMEYNDAKNEFIKREEQKALDWYYENI